MPEQIEDAVVLPSTPEPIPMKGVNNELFNKLVGYLDTRPHNEVRVLIDSLSSAPVINVLPAKAA